MEFLVLGIFCPFLILCIVSEASMIYALLAGFVLFMGYGKSRGYSWKELGHMAFEGIYKVKNILITKREEAQAIPVALTNYAFFVEGRYVTHEIQSEKILSSVGIK